MPVFKPLRKPEWARTTLAPSAVRTRTGLIFFFGISVLILVTVGASLWISGMINQDEQRLALVEQLRARARAWPVSTHQQTGAALTATDNESFSATFQTLQNGGAVLQPDGTSFELRPAGQEDLSGALEQAAAAFQALIQASRAVAQDAESPAAFQAFAQQTSKLNEALDSVASLLQLDRADKLGMVRGLYAALFLSASCYLLIGLWFTEQLIAKPFEELIHIAYRIAAGDLDTPISLDEHDEYDELAQSFETMRLDLRASREQLARWADEMEARVLQRTQQLGALSRVITAASRSLDLEEVLRVALEQSLQVLGVETGGIWLINDGSGDLKMAVSQGMSPEHEEQLRYFRSGEGATGRAARSGETIVLEDLGQSSAIINSAAIRDGLQSLVAVPIKVHDRVLGVLNIMNRSRRSYSPEEIALLTSIGQQIGIGVENASLIQEIRAHSERVAALQEREMISAELHDGLLQNLGYLHLKADQLETQALSVNLPEMAEQLANQRQVLEQTSREIRRFITELRQSPPSSVFLHVALQKVVNDFMAEFPLEVTLITEGPAGRMKADHVAHLARISREALLNAVRHGKARHAVLIFTSHEMTGQLNIQDDGNGFQSNCVPEDGSAHFGLSIMRARAARLNGQLYINSKPEHGTRVTVTWPLEID